MPDEPTDYDDAPQLTAAAQILQVLEDEIDGRLAGMDDEYRLAAKRAVLAFITTTVEADHAYQRRATDA